MRQYLKKLLDWLYPFCIEQPKITKNEKIFLESIQDGYIARNESDILYFYTLRPYKYDTYWSISNYLIKSFKLNSSLFPFIQWEDDEPYSTKDLLKLKVRRI